MGTYTEYSGDLFDSSAPVLGHGVNTAGLMGAGVAVEFKHRWPTMYLEYKQMCRDDILVPGKVMWWTDDTDYVLNIASQNRPGKFARLEWVESGIDEALAWCQKEGLDTLAVPRIGCGIGGLDWVDVKEIFEYYVSNSETNLEVWIK